MRKNENVRLRICAYAYMRMYADVWDEKGTGRLDPCLNQRASTLRKVDTLISLCPPASALLGRPSRNDAALASASSPSSTTATPGAREAATAIATGPNATQWNLCSTRRDPAGFSWDRQKRACAGPLSGSVNSTGPNTSPDTTILLTVSKPRLLPSQAIRLGG